MRPHQYPDDWKPFDDVGTGTKEIRIREASGIYRGVRRQTPMRHSLAQTAEYPDFAEFLPSQRIG